MLICWSDVSLIHPNLLLLHFYTVFFFFFFPVQWTFSCFSLLFIGHFIKQLMLLVFLRQGFTRQMPMGLAASRILKLLCTRSFKSCRLQDLLGNKQHIIQRVWPWIQAIPKNCSHCFPSHHGRPGRSCRKCISVFYMNVYKMTGDLLRRRIMVC